MKYFILSILVGCMIQQHARSQDPLISTQFVNRNVHQQDDHYIITTLDETVYVYAALGDTIISSGAFPFLLPKEDTTSIHSWETIDDVTVFPNPTYDVVILQRRRTEDEYLLECFTSDGKILNQVKWAAGVSAYQYGLSSAPKGIYVLRVTSIAQQKSNQYKILKL